MGSLVAMVLVSLTLILLLRESHPAYAMLTAAVTGAIVLITLLQAAYDPVAYWFSKLTAYGVKSEFVTYLLKAFGLCYITKFAAELCQDFGQTSLSSKVELAGRVALFLLSLPLLQQILEVGLSL